MSFPGGITKLDKTPNVIVVPIQISKDMIASKQGEKGTASGESSISVKAKESPAKATPKAAGTSKKGSEAGDSDKETPKAATKAKKAATPKVDAVQPKPEQTKADAVQPKSEQTSPEPTRRSKRESKLSSKLAEWGLVPSAGKKLFLPF